MTRPSFLRSALSGAALLVSVLQAGAQSPEQRHVLYDDKSAPLDLKGWESHSFPLGNGHFGVNFFAGVGEDLWQFTEKSVFVADPKKAEKAWDRVGLSSLAS